MNQNSPLSFSNIFKRETKLAAYFIICLTLVVLSVSYALFFSVDNNSQDQVVTAGDLKFTYQNGDTITSDDSEGGTKKSICFQPMSDDEAELYWDECSYKFSVQNTGSLNASYSLSLSALTTNQVDASKLKVILRKVKAGNQHEKETGFPKTISELGAVTQKEEDSTADYSLLKDVKLEAKETAVYEVQIYLDEKVYISEEDSLENKKIDYRINGKGIVYEQENLDPAKPVESILDNPQETVDDEGNGLYEVTHDDLTTEGGGSN